jgi:hypothetical protein
VGVLAVGGRRAADRGGDDFDSTALQNVDGLICDGIRSLLRQDPPMGVTIHGGARLNMTFPRTKKPAALVRQKKGTR